LVIWTVLVLHELKVHREQTVWSMEVRFFLTI